MLTSKLEALWRKEDQARQRVSHCAEAAQPTLLRHLAEIDPETKKPRVFSVCAGVKSEEKWQVMNASLLEFSKRHKKIACAKKLIPDATDKQKAIWTR
jgi:hypothetical protein